MRPRFTTLLSIVALLCALISSISHAQIPKTINYQGYLTTPSGAAVNNSNLQMVFKLYNAATGGTELHAETQMVTVTNGIFNVLLGPFPTLTQPFTAAYFLGVTVSSDLAEMTPRRPLTSAPYAITAENIAPGGNLYLSSSTATVGNVFKNGHRFMHNYGVFNTFLGERAGNFTLTGQKNAAVGYEALQVVTSGTSNTAVGNYAARLITSGMRNTAIGDFALTNNVSSDENTAVGVAALVNATSGGNTALGAFAGNNLTTGGNNIMIGNNGVAGESDTIRLGKPGHLRTYLSGEVGINLGATVVTSGRPLTIQANTTTNGEWIGLKDSAGTTKWHVNHKSGGINFAETGLADGRLFVAAGGNVGIGTDTPTKAKLEINGSTSTALTFPYRVDESGGVPLASGNYNLSVYANNVIAAPEFLAFSDQRMKRVLGRSNATRDLATLDAIEITDYTHIDTAIRGDKSHKKVIAQQVEKVFPQAVNKITDVVPDIYQRAAVKDGWIALSTNLKKGERVRLIGNATQGVHEVLEVAAGRFRTAFKADADTVFVFGREVKDFRTVDYEAIAMLNVSATQELHRRMAAQDARLTAQAAEIAVLKTQLSQLGDLQDKVATLMAQAASPVAVK
jgi:hypothetical protein